MMDDNTKASFVVLGAAVAYLGYRHVILSINAKRVTKVVNELVNEHNREAQRRVDVKFKRIVEKFDE